MTGSEQDPVIILALDDVSFRYPGTHRAALKKMSLRVQRGSWTFITGPNAAGKTTLARLIKGLIKPDSGDVRILDRSAGIPGRPTGSPEGDKGLHGQLPDAVSVGYLGGDPYDWVVGMTVEEDVVFGLENLCVPSEQIAHRLAQALQWTGLTGMEKRLAQTLSGGEQQRLALAAVLAMGARILVLDEALNMLDRPSRSRIRSLINGLRMQPGLTVLEISHNLEDSVSADRLVFLDSGEASFDKCPLDFLTSDQGLQWATLAGGVPALLAMLGPKLGTDTVAGLARS